MTSKHRENSLCWRVVGKQAAGINYHKIIENLPSYTNPCICDLLGMRAVERSYPKPLAGRQFYRPCPRGLCYRDKDASGWIRDYEAVYQASTWPSASVDTFVLSPLQNQDYRTNRGYSYAISKKLLLYCVTCYLSQNKSFCWNPYLVISLSRLYICYFLPIICTNLIIHN